jgi:hypothetical protein
VVGNIIKAKTAKSRLSKENKQVEVYRDTNVIASEINLIKLQTRNVVIQSSIEIGIRLKEAKELLPAGWSKMSKSEDAYWRQIWFAVDIRRSLI